LPRQNRQRGAALLLVLWVVALLSVMAATLLLVINRSMKNAQYLLERTQLQALADSTVNKVIWQALSADSTAHPSLDGQPHAIGIIGGSAQAAITDEAGRVDLNAAAPELLKALLQEAGADVLQSEAIVHGIEQKRHGGSSAFAAEAQRASASAPGLLDVGDLISIGGMTPPLYEQIRAAATVYTRSSAVDVRYAPALVRKALVRAHQADAQSLLQASKTTDDSASLAGRVLRIQVKVTLQGGASLDQTDIVRVTGSPTQPYWLMAQTQGF